ncbi:MAG: ThiF family adenylyltransferase [Desulfobacteraceae bacterium]|jgi:molybdopterin/thiamine biosynthesis adenylyltransferase|nr:MAG: ThiF family adenylyltransferase [Desulfobacteraceae bacterium]
MNSETNRIDQLIRDLKRGDNANTGLVVGKLDRKLRLAKPSDDPDSVIHLSAEDLRFGSLRVSKDTKIILAGETLLSISCKEGPHDVMFLCWDDGDVFTLLEGSPTFGGAPGSILFQSDSSSLQTPIFGKSEDLVRVIIHRDNGSDRKSTGFKHLGEVAGYVFNGHSWISAQVEVLPLREEIFSRNGGILETGAISDKKVAVIGEGSHGSSISLKLVKTGVTDFGLMDHDRYEFANNSRHAAGYRHAGRYKVNIIRDLIKERNPYASVQTWAEEASWDNLDLIKKFIRGRDLVISGTGDHESNRVINKACIEEGVVLIVSYSFRRAYGGAVLRVYPRRSMCYECFCKQLPGQSKDREISNEKKAKKEFQYSDLSVPIEPGLSIDISPITTMVVKLAIQELLKGKKSTLESLDYDLVAPAFLYLNRRETGTQFEKLEPLEYNTDGMHILRWYGIEIERDPACPACGDFEKHMAEKYGVPLC